MKNLIFIFIITVGVTILSSMISQMVFDGKHILTDAQVQSLIMLLGILFGQYTAARALPGSPEYTPEKYRDIDKTLGGSK